jgi:uncharacterized protein YdeI (YjbR/CyaY-like superfamily)
MGTKDPRIDAYINDKAPDFAKPILKKLRALVHKGCPAVVEAMKWSNPSFDYKGIFCGMSAFKQHCTFGFWKDKLLRENAQAASALDALGRIHSVNDLPADAVILGLIKKAAKLNEEGVKIPKEFKPPRKPLPVPKDFAAALKKTKGAAAEFDALPPSHKREYIEWIVEAKADETRQRRVTTAVEWIAQGKSKNWKYERK